MGQFLTLAPEGTLAPAARHFGRTNYPLKMLFNQ
jgi:hypothetical protein